MYTVMKNPRKRTPRKKRKAYIKQFAKTTIPKSFNKQIQINNTENEFNYLKSTYYTINFFFPNDITQIIFDYTTYCESCYRAKPLYLSNLDIGQFDNWWLKERIVHRVLCYPQFKLLWMKNDLGFFIGSPRYSCLTCKWQIKRSTTVMHIIGKKINW